MTEWILISTFFMVGLGLVAILQAIKAQTELLRDIRGDIAALARSRRDEV
jgi:hypothetical protein